MNEPMGAILIHTTTGWELKGGPSLFVKLIAALSGLEQLFT